MTDFDARVLFCKKDNVVLYRRRKYFHVPRFFYVGR